MRISLLALFYAYEFVYKVVRTKQVKGGTRVTHRLDPTILQHTHMVCRSIKNV